MSQLADDTKLQQVYRQLSDGISHGQFKTGQRLPTEEELAEQFGFSRTTVAKAIRMLAQEGLVRRRRRAGSFVCASSSTAVRTLGAIIGGASQPDSSANIFIPISSEIGHVADQHGYAVVVQDPIWRSHNNQEVAERIERMTRQLIARRVAGVFLVPPEIAADQEQSMGTGAAEELDRAGIPLVLLDRDIYRYPKRSKFDLVGIDNRRAAHVLTDHLLGLGYRKIDFIAWPTFSSAAVARLQGYRDALEAASIASEAHRIHRGDTHERSFIEQILKSSDAEAFIAINDATAADVMRHVLALGKRIPHDFRIVGFDDLAQSRYLAAPLTTIRQSGAEIGAAAVRTLFDRMQNPTRKAIEVEVSFDLVVRQSCGASLPRSA